MSDLPLSVTMTALPGIPMIRPGEDLVAIIFDALERAGLHLADRDVLVVTSKIVSKAEGRIVDLDNVSPRHEAVRVAEEVGKDPRVVELVLRESRKISRKARGVLVVEHRLGFVSANAGIDQSNLEQGDERVLLMPMDPDESARRIRSGLQQRTGADVAVVISDSHGRPFRMGNTGAAVGVAGLQALVDLRGQEDLFGRKLQITLQPYADLVASAALLLSGESSEGRPVVLLRGLNYPPGDGRAADLYRAPEQDLYR